MSSPDLPYGVGAYAADAAPKTHRKPRSRRGGSALKLAPFTRSLAALVAARMPLLRALESLAAEEGGEGARGVLQDVTEALEDGASLSEALARRPGVFDGAYRSLVRVGEETGTLGEVLGRLADRLERRAAVRQEIKKALAYPALVLAVALAATVFMLQVVVPMFADMYADFGAELPGLTRWLLEVSTFMNRHATLVLAGLALGAVGLYAGMQTALYVRLRDRAALRLPLVSSLTRSYVAAQMCQTLATLTKQGVPLDEALEVTSAATSNHVLAARLTSVRRDVQGGRSIRSAFSSADVLPARSRQLIALGEETGQLPALLERAATWHANQTEHRVAMLLAVLEPLLIIVVGLLLGTILTALYLPIFDLSTAIG